jgi:hypothetical protein
MEPTLPHWHDEVTQLPDGTLVAHDATGGTGTEVTVDNQVVGKPTTAATKQCNQQLFTNAEW